MDRIDASWRTVTACPALQTERLQLRPFAEGDVDAYTALLQTPQVRRSLRLADTIDESVAWYQMAGWLGQWELRGTGQWALEELTTGQFVGRAGLHNPNRPGWPGVEVGWSLHPDHWGKGYATEAGAKSVEYGFNTLGLDELFSCILHDNARSIAVARRLGFEWARDATLVHYPDEPHGIWHLARP